MERCNVMKSFVFTGRVMASTARHFPSAGNGCVAAANNSTNGSCTKKISKYSSSTHKFPQLPSSNRLNGHPHNSSDCSLKKPMSCRQKGLLVTTCSGAFFILSAVIWWVGVVNSKNVWSQFFNRFWPTGKIRKGSIWSGTTSSNLEAVKSESLLLELNWNWLGWG